jgi:hypothetical protein
MNRSTQRILITDLGSPPWPPDLLAVILTKEHGGSFDAGVYTDRNERLAGIEPRKSAGRGSGWSGSREHLAPL